MNDVLLRPMRDDEWGTVAALIHTSTNAWYRARYGFDIFACPPGHCCRPQASAVGGAADELGCDVRCGAGDTCCPMSHPVPSASQARRPRGARPPRAPVSGPSLPPSLAP